MLCQLSLVTCSAALPPFLPPRAAAAAADAACQRTGCRISQPGGKCSLLEFPAARQKLVVSSRRSGAWVRDMRRRRISPQAGYRRQNRIPVTLDHCPPKKDRGLEILLQPRRRHQITLLSLHQPNTSSLTTPTPAVPTPIVHLQGDQDEEG